MGTLGALTFGIQVFVTLIVIIDPPGVMPIFLSLVSKYSIAEQRRLAWKTASVSLLVIITFALFGQFILDYLKISLPALQGAGGLLLLLVALDLLIGNRRESADDSDVNVALVPLGTPLLAGPGAIVATIIFVKQANSANSFSMIAALFVAIIVLHLFLGLVLAYSTGIIKIIKKSGVTLIARIAGLLLAAIAVQMIADSVRAFITA
ncbi:MAG: MarC family protein [Actinobacteria bacterium]|nr:MarC family protein [Actinomycetota bacterium]